MRQWLVFGIIVLAWLFIFAMLLPHAAWPKMIDQSQFSLDNLPVGAARPCRKIIMDDYWLAWAGIEWMTEWRLTRRPRNRLRMCAI